MQCKAHSHLQISRLSHLLAPALLAFPGLFAAPPPPQVFPFIFLVEKPVKSPLLIASPLFEKRFFPPNPNFSFFFWRLLAPPFSRRWSRLESDLDTVSSSATSKRSASSVAVVGGEPSCRSVEDKNSAQQREIKYQYEWEGLTPLQNLDLLHRLLPLFIPLLQLRDLDLLPEFL